MGNPTNTDAPKEEVTTSAKFIQEAFQAHNNFRAKHGSQPLALSDELCKVAQAWANNIAAKGALQHSTSGFGENIFWSSKAIKEGKAPVDKWYSEIKDFNWKSIDHQKGTVHFTQVIWKDCKELGIATAVDKNGGTYVVANYYPGGNVLGYYEKNIFPVK